MEPTEIRVFPRRTSYTPTDERAFVGGPPAIAPPAERILVSVTFSWDRQEGERLADAWQRRYPAAEVLLGGPAFGSPASGFVPGRFVRTGVTFTSRGCLNRCPWCLVPAREGPLQEIRPVPPGYVIADNNFAQTSPAHRAAVYAMLATERRAAIFSGGIQASLVTDELAWELRGLRIGRLFLAADTVDALEPLEQAIGRLRFLSREKLRCYVLVGFRGERLEEAERRLRRVWELGAMPFVQFYRPATDERAPVPVEWRRLLKTWSRPAIMKAEMRAAGLY